MQEKVIPNPSTLLAPVTTTARSYFPFPGRLALCCSIIPLSVIKGSQGELRWSEREEQDQDRCPYFTQRLMNGKEPSVFIA